MFQLFHFKENIKKYINYGILLLLSIILLTLFDNLILNITAGFTYLYFWTKLLKRIELTSSHYTRLKTVIYITSILYILYIIIPHVIFILFNLTIPSPPTVIRLILGLLITIILLLFTHIYYITRLNNIFFVFELMLVITGIILFLLIKIIILLQPIIVLFILGNPIISIHTLIKFLILISLSIAIFLLAWVTENKYLIIAILPIAVHIFLENTTLNWYLLDYLVFATAVYIFYVDIKIPDLYKKFGLGETNIWTYRFLFIASLYLYLKLTFGL